MKRIWLNPMIVAPTVECDCWIRLYDSYSFPVFCSIRIDYFTGQFFFRPYIPTTEDRKSTRLNSSHRT